MRSLLAVLWLLAGSLCAQNGLPVEEPDETRRAEKVRALLREDLAANLPLALRLLSEDPSSRVRSVILDRIGGIDRTEVRQALRERAGSDPDPRLAVAAFEKLRLLQNRSALAPLERRLKLARESGNREEARYLALEHERWLAHSRGSRLPGFMQTPPPVFAVKPGGEPIRVLAFGDFGQGTAFQKTTAAAMLAFHRRQPFDFAITLGDNFYPRGMESPSDPRWKTWWSELYDPLGIRFYASLGNHDWGLADSPAAEYLYALQSPSWRLPATRYSFTAGPAQFFAIDSQLAPEAQLLWLEEELERSTARWKIVYGHHPVYSHGQHGDTPGLVRSLLPVLKGRADAYLAGHDHDLQHLRPEGGVHFFIAGGGGAGVRPITPGPRSLFAASSYGFAVLEADGAALKVRFVNRDLSTLYEYTLRK